jgi:hypothetical protein
MPSSSVSESSSRSANQLPLSLPSRNRARKSGRSSTPNVTRQRPSSVSPVTNTPDVSR